MNDRGSKKWTALMLPEHVELLQSLWHNNPPALPPELDEQQLEILQYALTAAVRDQKQLDIVIYDRNERIRLAGYVKKINRETHSIVWQDCSGEIRNIGLHCIFEIN
ncbi:YolD-like family protein [Virgibacillus sp. 179-BFC.A HS]|uniref:YolD-like family protein n=1 Tax=Tigheibacillus jepli TaxID=3035914 RepID=A0ABU5CHH5_9BACI|nr:YolD-like family protein [Virgibacillus sp. 179-BFC.A HS]MDY0405751.1 YolD-like family protein [Virgibacillus sp. 179-BFC.A HS]